MKSVSKLHEKCEKCEYKDDCNNKRMVACAYAEEPINLISACASDSIMQGIAAPIIRETISIPSSCGGKQTVYKDDIEKQLRQGFLYNQMLNYLT